MNTTLKVILGLMAVAFIGIGGWVTWQSQSDDELLRLAEDANAKITDEHVDRLIARVSQFMVVPQDEDPSVVVIRDADSLAQQQSFYKGANNGDFLLVYSNRAIIYDARDNKLVNVGPIIPNENPPTGDSTASGSADFSPSPSPLEPEEVSIEVRNGTNTAGLAGATASDLRENDWVTISKVGDAEGVFTETVIIDLSDGENPGAIAALEELLDAEAVTKLPSGEKTSTADILVILGN